MMQIRTIVFGLACALAIGTLGFQAFTIRDLRGQLSERDKTIGQMSANFDQMTALADECTKTVEEFERLAEQQTAQAREAIEKARADGVAAGRRADTQRFRAPAVPGDACASAQQENREWLEGRKGAQ